VRAAAFRADQGDPSNDAARFERQFAVNVGGVAAAVRAAARVMGGGGRIISVGSILGEHVPFRGVADSSATKAAVAGYTRGCTALTSGTRASRSTPCSPAPSTRT
jgi:3-oxoacyl-[acyl-carrier protein] reductase